jgi:hypothetical protein
MLLLRCGGAVLFFFFCVLLTVSKLSPPPDFKASKASTFGRSFGKMPSRASQKDVFSAADLPPPPVKIATLPRPVAVQSSVASANSSPLSSPSMRSSPGPVPPPPVLEVSKKRTGMVGMAAAFDALISADEAQLAASEEAARNASRTPVDTEAQMNALQDRFDALEKEHEALKLKYRALEARNNELERTSGSGFAMSPQAEPLNSSLRNIPRMTAATSPSPNSGSPVMGSSSKTDAVKEEVGRLRKEIKSKSALALPAMSLRSDDLSASSGSIGSLGSNPSASATAQQWEGMEDAAIERFERTWLTKLNTYTFGDWRFSQVPGRTLVTKVEGYHIESGDALLDPLSSPQLRQYALVEPHLNKAFYADFMANIKHVNFVGISGIGAFADIPMVISVEQVSVSRSVRLRRKPLLCMIRAPSGTEQLCFCGYESPVAKLPYAAGTFVEFLAQRFPGSSFSPVRAPEAVAQLQKSLLQFEAMNIVKTYKIGVLRWVSGQSENDAFQNATSPAFQSLLEWLGERVVLKGWTKFRGGLNVRDVGVTGLHSYYTTLGEDLEIMFHVSTELPFSETDAQCLERKRHLGNDVVIIVFWEGDGEFDPSLVKSQFNHVFVVITVDGSSIPELDKIRYRITITCKTGVPRWEPYMPYPAVFDRDDMLREWLLYKVVNGERAAMHAPVFRTKLIKTNTTYLKNLVDTYYSDTETTDDLGQVKGS